MKFQFFLFLLIANLSFGQTADETLFNQKIKLQVGGTKAQTAIVYAKSFINRPYKAGTLEGNSKEQLVCNLRDFDCWTFVENVFAMTQTRYSTNPSYATYQDLLKKLRYRNGVINGYASRLHYFKEWVVRAEQNGYLKDVTSTAGGSPIEKDINFMTNHRNLYPNLKNENTFLAVQTAENELNGFDFYYIPKNRVEGIEGQIREGDIIAITSNIEGLDVNHEGFAIKKDGRIHLLHASQELKKVVISDEPLSDYLNRIKKHSGIIVARIL
jgi:hypothetical protein